MAFKGSENYTTMLNNLTMSPGDVIGFVDIEKEMDLTVTEANTNYHNRLRESARNDYVIIPDNTDSSYINANSPVKRRKMVNYRIDTYLDIALCNGNIFTAEIQGNQIITSESNDPLLYDSLHALMTRLWISADNKYLEENNTFNHTMDELKALNTKYNLSDAHTHQALPESLKALLPQLRTFWEDSHYTQQANFEKNFLQSFFAFRKCPHALLRGDNFINYSASSITSLLANFFYTNDLEVSLIEPCFDNLPDLLKDGGTIPKPLPERQIKKIIQGEDPDIHIGDVIFLVNPNNPTGFSLENYGASAYHALAQYCEANNKILVLDFTFMPFILEDEDRAVCDIYELFNGYSFNYLTIEDTGKILPVMDTKASILHASDGLVAEISRAHTNYILRVSPFILQVLTFILDRLAQDGLGPLYDLYRSNRRYLRQMIRQHDLPLEVTPAPDSLSIAWIRITNGLSASYLQNALRRNNIEILIGNNFFWSDKSQGGGYIRIALARERKEFIESIDTFIHTLKVL